MENEPYRSVLLRIGLAVQLSSTGGIETATCFVRNVLKAIIVLLEKNDIT